MYAIRSYYVNVQVNKLITEDLEDIDDYIKDYVAEFNAQNYGVELIMSRSFLEFLKVRLNILYTNGLQGLIP